MTFLWPQMLWLLLTVPVLVGLYFLLLRRKKKAAAGAYGLFAASPARHRHKQTPPFLPPCTRSST